MAKPESIVQLGLALKRIIHVMVAHRGHGRPFKFAKVDVKDDFWQMAVANDDAWNFSYVLPSIKENTSIDDIKILVPNSLQMGWCKRPPFFCLGSETARDIMERMRNVPLPPHIIEHMMMKKVSITNTKP